MAEEHKRRVHYSGKYPRHFNEKYKEHNPEKYADQIEHVISKGNTPAGMHIPIMVDEILDVLKIRPGMWGCDCTLGYGGHTRKMLECLEGQGHMDATDVDPIESEKTKKRLADAGFGEEILTIHRMNFRDVDQIRPEGGFDFLLADLGVSSMQIDDPSRGFSYKTKGPLDMRLDPTSGVPAADRLRELTEDEIAGMLIENSDEPFAEEIAKEITNTYRKGGDIRETTDLAEIVAAALKKVSSKKLPKEEYEDTVRKSCARTFQALRIDVNSEFEVIYTFLEKLPDVLAAGGRAAILTFHSGEDRLVKKAFRDGKKRGIYSEISEEVIRPGREECFRNPRAHSTKLRYCVKAMDGSESDSGI